jgi:ABC-type multidrug transport system permease subunit
MSVKSFLVIVTAMIQPCLMTLATVLSWARVIVSVSPTTFVMRTISALVGVIAPKGQTVASNGNPEKSEPVPAVTVRVVPDVAGDGAVTTRLQTLFGC